MCLALPAEVIALSETGEMATVSLAGVRKDISVTLLDDVAVGDFVLVHVGYALDKISPRKAALTLKLMEEAGVSAGEFVETTS